MYILRYINSTILYTRITDHVYIHHGWSLHNYWSIRRVSLFFFLSLKSKNSSPRETFNFNDSYCPLIDLMIFRCKSKKIASVSGFAVLRLSLRAQRRGKGTFGRYDVVHFDEKGRRNDKQVSEVKSKCFVLCRLTRNPRSARQPCSFSIQNNSTLSTGDDTAR